MLQTVSTCSSVITPLNGIASPRLPRSSVTGKSPSRPAKFFNHIRLQMDRQKVWAHRDAARIESLCHFIAVDLFIKADDIDEPRHARREGFNEWDFDSRNFRESRFIPRRNLFPFREDFIQPFHLRSAHRRGHFVDAVVVAEVGMLQPGIARRASLIAQGAHEVRGFIVIGDDDPAFAGCDLFVRIKREDAKVTERAGLFSFVGRAQRFA